MKNPVAVDGICDSAGRVGVMTQHSTAIMCAAVPSRSGSSRNKDLPIRQPGHVSWTAALHPLRSGLRSARRSFCSLVAFFCMAGLRMLPQTFALTCCNPKDCTRCTSPFSECQHLHNPRAWRRRYVADIVTLQESMSQNFKDCSELTKPQLLWQ